MRAWNWASATEGSRTSPQPRSPSVARATITARLKSCPFKAAGGRSLADSHYRLLLAAIHCHEQVVQRFRQSRVGKDAITQGGVGQLSHHCNLERRHNL